MAIVVDPGGDHSNDRFWRKDGSPPDYSVESVPGEGNKEFSGNASAADCKAFGSISGGMGTFHGGANSGFWKDVYAEVVTGSRVRVKFQANLSINWVEVSGSPFSYA
ncbi:MAG: hypothetical protein HY796_03330 [Elusimicrobia bacterium]|nr:hypothetical protein [Elusimicrobiota bacterium]